MTDEEMNQMTQEEELIALAKQQPLPQEPCFISEEDEASGAWQNMPQPTHVRTKSATEMFDMKPGETWEEYFARTNVTK